MRIRAMQSGDLDTVGELSAQLGYPVGTSNLADRFELITSQDHQALFVAEDNGRVLGWAHVYFVSLLESEGCGELGGLVVDESVRRQGAGCALMRAAEEWCTARDIARLRLHSGSHRHEAYQFYPAIGYEQIRPETFQKRLK